MLTNRLGSNFASNSMVIGFNQNLQDMYSSLAKLSSGSRINSAADDPAGLVISKQLQSQIGALSQEIDNISDLINKYEYASSTLVGLDSSLSELRSLAVGAANEGFNSEAAQQAYNQAADSLVRSYNRQITDAAYNGRTLFDGSEGSVATVGELTGVDLSSPEAVAASLEAIDAAASELSGATVELGATQRNELEARRTSLQVTQQNLTAAESSITDTDYAKEIANYMASMIRSQASAAMMVHSRIASETVLSLFNM